MLALIVVAAVAIVAMVLLAFLQSRHQSQLNAVLTAAAAERYREARERWDLNTRLTAPEVTRAAPPAPPADVPPTELLQALNVISPALTDLGSDDEDVDETFLVGTTAGEA